MSEVRRIRIEVGPLGLAPGCEKLIVFPHSHFGSDTIGVNTTRRYLCEALSFQYRYVPIGLLEHLPPRINDRAPAFRGRDELGECDGIWNQTSRTDA